MATKKSRKPVQTAKKLSGKRLPAVRNLTLTGKKYPPNPC
jgi:hypothetical protein